ADAKEKGGEKRKMSQFKYGSTQIKNLNEVLGTPKLKYGGVRMKINDLEGREIIIKDYYELPDALYGSNGNYVRMELDTWEDGLLKPITVNTSSRDIMEKLRKAKAQSALPVKATLRKVMRKDGVGYYWILG